MMIKELFFLGKICIYDGKKAGPAQVGTDGFVH
jgi:hypothetical protein